MITSKFKRQPNLPEVIAGLTLEYTFTERNSTNQVINFLLLIFFHMLDHLAPFLFVLAQVLVLAPITIGHYTANILQTESLTDHGLEIILLL